MYRKWSNNFGRFTIWTKSTECCNFFSWKFVVWFLQTDPINLINESLLRHIGTCLCPMKEKWACNFRPSQFSRKQSTQLCSNRRAC